VENHRSWTLADCPVCGEHKLKIVTEGKKYGAFGCYSKKECHKLRKEGVGYQPSLISAKLQEGEFRPKRRSSALRQIKLPPLRDIVKPLELNLQEVDVTQFFSSVPYEKPWSTYFEDGDKFTIYPYDDFQLIRIDPSPHKHEKKFFYFRIKKSGNWVNEVPVSFKHVPVYRSDYLQHSVIFCEGEKVASCLQELQLAAVSFPSFVYQQSYLAKFLRCLSHNKVKNIIYLEDNDTTGREKAQKFLQEAWKSGINASSYNIAQLLGRGAEKNYDAADAIDNWEICTREELLGLLKNAV